MMGLLQALSDPEKNDAALRENEQRLSFALSATLDGLWDWEIATGRVYFSAQWCRLLGYEPGELAERVETFYKLLYPGDAQRVQDLQEEHFAGRIPVKQAEVRLRAKSGEYRWFLDRGKVVARDEAGKPSRMVGTITDITARKKAEAALEEALSRLQKIAGRVPGVVYQFRLRPNGTACFPYASERMFELFRCTPDEVREDWSRILPLFPPDELPGLLQSIEKSARDLSLWKYEMRLKYDDGTERWIAGSSVPEREPDGSTLWHGFITDITERKQLEQQFLRAQRVESIGTLAGGIAHDLNNVLGPIVMALELLRVRFPDETSRELIDLISSSARAGAGMVKQVLSFARGVEGQRVEVQLRYVIKEIEKLINETFLKRIEVETHLPVDLWTVIADPTQLHQVLLNLCVNARDAMPDGGTLAISAENMVCDAQFAGLNLDAKPGPYVVLEIEDTGTGIAPEVLDRIFDPFFTTKSAGSGTGLGLSTSLGIVKSHGGFFRVTSCVGEGSKFQVYLPARAEAAAAVPEVIGTELPRGHGELILLVDDEAAMRETTAQVLKLFGYRTVLARDAAEAMEAIVQRRQEIAAAVIDMMMPAMDGPKTISAIQSIAANLPIIATSGLASEKNAAHALELGAMQFLPKPFPARILLEALRKALPRGS